MKTRTSMRRPGRPHAGQTFFAIQWGGSPEEARFLARSGQWLACPDHPNVRKFSSQAAARRQIENIDREPLFVAQVHA